MGAQTGELHEPWLINKRFWRELRGEVTNTGFPEVSNSLLLQIHPTTNPLLIGKEKTSFSFAEMRHARVSST